MAKDGTGQELERCTLVVTCVVVKLDPETHESTALILKRSAKEEEGPNLWTIPGGKVRVDDLGEQLEIDGVSHKIWMGVLERAILREVKEETGISANFVFLSPERAKIFIRKDGAPALVLVYWTLVSPETKVFIGSELTEYRWVREEELDNYEFIGNVKDDMLYVLSG